LFYWFISSKWIYLGYCDTCEEIIGLIGKGEICKKKHDLQFFYG